MGNGDNYCKYAQWHPYGRPISLPFNNNNGQRAITIDEVPLEWCFSDGVKLDLRSYEDGYVLTKSDLQNEIKKINYELKLLDIVFINTSAGGHYGKIIFYQKVAE